MIEIETLRGTVRVDRSLGEVTLRGTETGTLRLTPQEARNIADALVRVATEAENPSRPRP